MLIEEHLQWRDSIQKLAPDHNLPKCSNTANFNRTAKAWVAFSPFPHFPQVLHVVYWCILPTNCTRTSRKIPPFIECLGSYGFVLTQKNTDNWRYNRTYRGYNSITPFITSRGPPGPPCSYKNTTRAEPWNQGCKGWKLMLETKKQIRGPPFLKLHAIDIVSEVSIPLHGKQKNHQTQNPRQQKKNLLRIGIFGPPKKKICWIKHLLLRGGIFWMSGN